MATMKSRQTWIAVAALVIGGLALFLSLARDGGNAAYGQLEKPEDLSRLQFFGGNANGFYVFDSETGNIYEYERGEPKFRGRMMGAGWRLSPDEQK